MTEVITLLATAGNQGHADAQHSLAVLYHYGEGVIQDHEEAVRWYRKAAEQGIANSQYNLANMYLKGEGVAQDHKKKQRGGIGKQQSKELPTLSIALLKCTRMA